MIGCRVENISNLSKSLFADFFDFQVFEIRPGNLLTTNYSIKIKMVSQWISVEE